MTEPDLRQMDKNTYTANVHVNFLESFFISFFRMLNEEQKEEFISKWEKKFLQIHASSTDMDNQMKVLHILDDYKTMMREKVKKYESDE